LLAYITAFELQNFDWKQSSLLVYPIFF